MKIIEIGTGYTPIPAQMGAATEIVVEELTRSFSKLGEDVTVLDIAASQRAEHDLPIQEVGVPGVFTKNDVSLGLVHKFKRVVYSVCLASKLKKILKKSAEPVALHFHNQYNLFFFLKLTSKKLRRKAVIAYTVHSYIWGTEWETIRDTVKKRYFQEIACVRQADAVFVLNDITVDHFVTKLGVRPERIHKIVNGVSLEKYQPLSASAVEEIKERLGFSGKRILFQVGSVCERKNQLGSVQMLLPYLKQHPDVLFLYAGGVIDSEYQQSILDLAQREGVAHQVVYAGELAPGKTLNEYYNMAECSLFSSTLESFGLVIIEAIAAGKPVLLGSKPMFDLTDGVAVYRDETEFLSLLDGLLTGTHTVANRGEVVEKYHWDRVAEQQLEILKQTKIG